LKSATFFACILGALLATVGVASGASVDRDGTWVPSGDHRQTSSAGDRDLINDGSFELGPPPASAWTEVNDSDCERIGDFSGEWYVSAYDGMYDYWAGGYCIDEFGHNVPVTSSVTQTVHVPVDRPTLTFFYIAFRPDPDDDPVDGDHAYVSVNGNEVWTLPFTRANNTYPNWAGPVTVDLCAFAGQDVSLSFGGITEGDVTGNARFDYIEFISGASPVGGAGWGWLKALYR
jgi:hypothetical protein